MFIIKKIIIFMPFLILSACYSDVQTPQLSTTLPAQRILQDDNTSVIEELKIAEEKNKKRQQQLEKNK